jgi:hypothetical protein
VTMRKLRLLVRRVRPDPGHGVEGWPQHSADAPTEGRHGRAVFLGVGVARLSFVDDALGSVILYTFSVRNGGTV